MSHLSEHLHAPGDRAHPSTLTRGDLTHDSEEPSKTSSANDWQPRLRVLLDSAHAYLMSGQGKSALQLVQRPLAELLEHASADTRADDFSDLIRTHPLHALAAQCPLTQRCVQRPRGYAGDAVMMDLIYSRRAPAEATDVGKYWFDFVVNGSMSQSVRYRKDLLRAYIDDAVDAHDNYAILSVASGHSRELESSLVLDPKHQGCFIGMDQDEESCAVAREAYAARADGRVEILAKGVRSLLAEHTLFADRRFDLIYSAGLYDYLADRTAVALTARLIGLLNPGGRLVLANFLPNSASRGYATALMDWHLIYRTPAQFTALFGSAAARITTSIDPQRNVVYAEYR